jgi:hypothetical protein
LLPGEGFATLAVTSRAGTSCLGYDRNELNVTHERKEWRMGLLVRSVESTLRDTYDDLHQAVTDAKLVSEIASLLEWHRGHKRQDEVLYIRLERNMGFCFDATYYHVEEEVQNEEGVDCVPDLIEFDSGEIV